MRQIRIGKRIRLNFGAGQILEGTLIAKDDIGISVVNDKQEGYSVEWDDIEPRMLTVIETPKKEKSDLKKAA